MKKNEAVCLAKNPSTLPGMLESMLGIHKHVDQLLALHPNSPPSLLVVLACGSDKLTQRYAMGHPNLPLEQLIQLAALFPAELTGAPGLSRLSTSQLTAVASLIGPVKLSRLLKHEDCPANVLAWAVETGTDAIRLSVANRHQLPVTVKQILMELGGDFAAAASKPRKIIMNWQGWVIGDYPRHMNIRRLEKSAAAEKRSWDELTSKSHRPIFTNTACLEKQPDLYLFNNDVVESINLNVDYLSANYLVFENLPKLKKIEIIGDIENRSSSLHWIAFRNLPALEEVSIKGRVRWVEFDEMPLLRFVRLNDCVKLAHLDIRNAPYLEELGFANCRMLREVGSLEAAQLERLQVHAKINAMQAKSKLDLKLKKSMTFTEIDAVLRTINEGCKLAVQKGLLQGIDRIDICSKRESDPDFRPFSYRMLRPLEPVYTGGTGETYFYEQCFHDYTNGRYGISGSMGCEEPQDCLEESLRTVISLTEADSSPSQMLAFFVKLLAQEDHTAVIDSPKS